MSRRRPWAAVVEALEAEGVEYVFGLPGNPSCSTTTSTRAPCGRSSCGWRPPPCSWRWPTRACRVASVSCTRARGRVWRTSCRGCSRRSTRARPSSAWSRPRAASTREAAGSRTRRRSRWSGRSRSGRCGSICRSGRRGRCSARSPWRRTASPAPSTSRFRSTSPRRRRRSRTTGRRWSTCAAPATPARSSGRHGCSSAAERPVIWAGGGVGLSGAEEALVTLAESLDAPVVTTPSGRGSISEAHRLAFGIVGLYRTRSSADRSTRRTAFSTWARGSRSSRPALAATCRRNARAIQVDVDPFEIERVIEADVAIAGDAKLVLEQLAEATPGRGRPSTAARRVQGGVRTAVETSAPRRPGRSDEADRPRAEPRLRRRLRARPGERRTGLWSYYCPYLKVTEHRGCVAPPSRP